MTDKFSETTETVIYVGLCILTFGSVLVARIIITRAITLALQYRDVGESNYDQ